MKRYVQFCLQICGSQSQPGPHQTPCTLLICKEHRPGWQIEVKKRPVGSTGFVPLPKRWVVERTFGWLTRCRRLARDYERKSAHAEAMIDVAMIRLMAARLAGEDIEPEGPIETEAARRLAEDLKDQK